MIRDQEEAGLDIVTDGQMSYDDYVGVIGSFCWYMYERIGGFEPAREPHPSEVGAATRDKDDRAARRLGRRHQQRPGRRAGRSASPTSTRSPQQLRDEADQGLRRRRPGQPRLARVLPALQGRRGAELRAGADLQRRDEGPRRRRRHVPAARGSRCLAAAVHRQREGLRVDQPTSSAQCCDGVDAKIGWHFCFGNAWGNDILSAQLPEGLPDGAAALLRHARDRPVRARLREPRHGRHRVPEEPAGGQGGRRSACSTSAR